MEDVYIRKATVKDLEDIVNLASQLWETEQAFDSNLKDFYCESKNGIKDLKKEIEKENMIFLVATINDKVVGFLNGYVKKEKGAHKRKVAYLDKMCVDNKYRRKGISGLLMNKFEGKLKKEDVGFIQVNAFDKNIPAASFYKKEGFYEYSVMYMKKL